MGTRDARDGAVGRRSVALADVAGVLGLSELRRYRLKEGVGVVGRDEFE